MDNLKKTIQYIAKCSNELKNIHTNETAAPIEFVCIFCQNEDEYNDFTKNISRIGRVAEDTSSGFTYLLDKPINTVAGPLRLVKVRKPDIQRRERGDADFNTDYTNFGEKYQNNSRLELVKRNTFEMLRLSDPNYDVMACFSNIPKSKNLDIEL